MLIAHRGFRSKDGENCMADFENALKTCKAVEFDIRLTKDKKIIIFHDSTFIRIGNSSEAVRDLTYQEILELPFFKENPRWTPPLFIEDFTNKIANQYEMINVEIKASRYSDDELEQLRDALDILRSKTTAEVVVSSFSRQCLEFITTLDGNKFKKAYLIEWPSDVDRDLLKKFDFLNPWLGSVKIKRNQEFYINIGMPMNIYTFSKQSDVDKVREMYPKKLLNGYFSDVATLEVD